MACPLHLNDSIPQGPKAGLHFLEETRNLLGEFQHLSGNIECNHLAGHSLDDVYDTIEHLIVAPHVEVMSKLFKYFDLVLRKRELGKKGGYALQRSKFEKVLGPLLSDWTISMMIQTAQLLSKVNLILSKAETLAAFPKGYIYFVSNRLENENAFIWKVPPQDLEHLSSFPVLRDARRAAHSTNFSKTGSVLQYTVGNALLAEREKAVNECKEYLARCKDSTPESTPKDAGVKFTLETEGNYYVKGIK